MAPGLCFRRQPVYLYEFGPSNAGLQTGGEPTGEEEGLAG
jgi:hypothetical protein